MACDKYLIEFDGIQHFDESKSNFYGKSSEIKERDQYKNQWCEDNNIPLIRIPYTHLPKLELKDLLLESSTFIVKLSSLKNK